MTPKLTHLTLDGLDRLLALFGMLARLSGHPALSVWASGVQGDVSAEIVRRFDSVAVALGEQPPPRIESSAPDRVTLDALATGELIVLHDLFAEDALNPHDEVCAWLTRLNRGIVEALGRQEAAQDRRPPEEAVATMVDNARAAAMDAELHRESQEHRPDSDLSGIPPWSQAAGG
jgi:hypothetical protein